MKIRNGFVSNSSSSSFIVINNTGEIFEPKFEDNVLIIDQLFGETEFGWGVEKLEDHGSKVIFAYLQAHYCNKDDYIEMLEEVLRDHYNVSHIEWKLSENCSYVYIDHQSIGGDNLDMFNSINDLENFLFNKDSYIMLDNDNY